VKQITLHGCGGAHDGEPSICAKRHFEASCPAASAVIFQHSSARTIRALAPSHASVRSIEALAEWRAALGPLVNRRPRRATDASERA
jgi:hypothetical protein